MLAPRVQNGSTAMMSMTSRMMDAAISMPGMDTAAMQDLIEACSACEQACTICADS